jgi:phosphoribosylformylglycinamidine cyclo-ligase
MYKVFNMGHRFELYLPGHFAQKIMEISEEFGIDAKIIGRCEVSSTRQLSIISEFGEYYY